MPSAIVTGATGILGRAIVKQLGQDPAKWTKVYTLSRSKKEDFPSNTEHKHIDLCGSADDMASDLSSIKENVEYVFFAAYLAQDAEDKAARVNGAMLRSFLAALDKTGLAKSVKRIVLVTGCKQYGVHLGPVKNPMQEADPWLRDEARYPPNFYYVQQDILREWCEGLVSRGGGGGTTWTVTYPNDVIGVARGNFMNLATSLGLYVAVSRELGAADQGGLVFPGSERFYTGFDCLTDAGLHARFCEWAALEPKAADQAYNVVNGDTESYQNLFPRLAARFGLKVRPDQFAADTRGVGEPSSVTLNDPPPTAEFAAATGLEGRTPPGKLENKVDLVQWSQREDVKKAWQALASREGLEKEAFEQATWGFLGFVLGRSYDMIISMSKAREHGWTGYLDTWTAFEQVFDILESEKILPKTK